MLKPSTSGPSPLGLCVETDLYCIHCGYNLRTLPWDSVCPECSRPVRDSFLSDSQLIWLAKVRCGLTLLFVSSILACVLGLSTFASATLAPVSSSHTVIHLLSQVVMLCAIIGVFATTRPASTPCHPGLRPLRWVARICAIGILVCAISILVFAIIQSLGLMVFGSSIATHGLLIFWFGMHCLVLGYVFLLARGLRIHLRPWWLLAVTLTIILFALSETETYLVRQQIATKRPAVLSSPLFTAFFLLAILTKTSTFLAHAMFYYRARAGFTRLVATRRIAKNGLPPL